jgi:hypothetical protein
MKPDTEYATLAFATDDVTTANAMRPRCRQASRFLAQAMFPRRPGRSADYRKSCRCYSALPGWKAGRNRSEVYRVCSGHVIGPPLAPLPQLTCVTVPAPFKTKAKTKSLSFSALAGRSRTAITLCGSNGIYCWAVAGAADSARMPARCEQIGFCS